MKTIYKYPLVVAERQSVLMPLGAEILSVQVQGEQPCIWALVDTSKPRLSRIIAIFGTGHEVPTDVSLRFIGTFQVSDGLLVFHVFEEATPC